MGAKDVHAVPPERLCACFVKKVKAVNLKAYLCCVISLSVVLVFFMIHNVTHEKSSFYPPSYVINETELLINITELKGEV